MAQLKEMPLSIPENPKIQELEETNMKLRELLARGEHLLDEIRLKLDREKIRQKHTPPFTPDRLTEPLN
ncbi:MAG: hypothetical protein Q7K39_03615 [Candidatus Magasanikbacteria bacterium]|nr:hypothetical protein [Candidatus Magasanikbacteria bacterium]